MPASRSKWFVPEVHSAAASRLLDPEIRLRAPDFFSAEMGNIFWKKIRRGELTIEQASDALIVVHAVGIVFSTSADLLSVALDLAVALNHPVYDCVYLALARARNCAVVTADERFAAAAAATHARYVRFVEDAL
jgi:predicted nucleic acid-binding protein